VYLENENELVQAVTTGEVVDGLEGTVGAKLLKRDVEGRVVVNFHGVSSFLRCLFPCGYRSSISLFMSTFFAASFTGQFHNCYNLITLAPLVEKEFILEMPRFCLLAFPTPSFYTLSNTPTERRPRRPRLPTINIPLHLRYPPHSSSNLRLPRLRPLQPQELSLHPHRGRHNH
jgi:hypothetical protein